MLWWQDHREEDNGLRVEDLVCRYGIAYTLIADNGMLFDNYNFKEFCQNLRMELEFCSTAHS